MENYKFTVTSANGYESLVAGELGSLGIKNYSIGKGNVSFSGTQYEGLKVCLWSRIASRVLLHLFSLTVKNEKDIYKKTSEFEWENIFSPDKTFAVNTVLSSDKFKNASYLSLVLKDGIADYFRKKTGRRPDVQTEQPDILINLFIERDRGTVSLDMAGSSLHRRGYRIAHTEAPLKENAAAALLYRGGWPEIRKNGGSFIDPMCGSGTLVIEAMMMAAEIPPVFDRNYFCFKNWKKFNRDIWEELRKKAAEKISTAIPSVPAVFGFDYDRNAIEAAKKNVSKAFSLYPPLPDKIIIEKKEIHKLRIPQYAEEKPGLIGVNPPYGERLGEREKLLSLYKDMGIIFKERFEGWKGVFITGDEELARKTGLKASKINKIYNGPIECISAVFSLNSDYRQEHKKELSPGAQMFLNRITKNMKALGKIAKKEDISCYRIYDADLPDYSAAIDFYENKWFYLQEYAAPAYIDPLKTKRRVKEMEQALSGFTEKENIFVRRRERQKGPSQYMKTGETGKYEIVGEGGFKFYLNFSDYIDTGIFLDHRRVRKLIYEMSGGKSFLNLFAYTCTASVYAAEGGASETTSVDVSSAYLKWGENNFVLNNLDPAKHKFIKADCMGFLKNCKKKYDLIFIDPPTFSNSKSRSDIFDVQKDHFRLINMAAEKLERSGTIIFSTNFRRFKLNSDIAEIFEIKDITEESIPFDFKRNKNIHKCWILKKKR